MVEIFELQCSINRAVSSVLGFKGAGNEIDSLKSLCLALESLKLNKNSTNSNYNGINYGTEEDFYQFLDNLRRLMGFFSTRLAHSKSLDSQVSHLYIKILLNIINTLKNNNYQYQYDVLSLPLLKIWCEVLCLPGSNRIDQYYLKKNHQVFVEYIPLLLSTYKCVKSTEDLNRLLYVILEVFRNTEDEEFLRQILEALEFIPESLGFQGFVSVYPGVISKLFNKLQNLNLVLFTKAVNSMIVWFRCFLDSRKEVYNSKVKQYNPVLKNVDNKEEILEKTEETIKMTIKGFKNTRQQSVGVLCVKCMEYEFLDSDLRYMMARCILNCISKKDNFIGLIRENMKEIPVSFNLILRDIVTSAINENNQNEETQKEEKQDHKGDDNHTKNIIEMVDEENENNSRNRGLEIFNSYLILREYLTWEIDNYLVLKFLINNVQVDFSGVNDKIVLNKKYLVDKPSSVPDSILEKQKEVETFSRRYFDTLSSEIKLEMLSNLLLVYRNSNNSTTLGLKILYLMNEIVNSVCHELPEYNINSRNDECKETDGNNYVRSTDWSREIHRNRDSVRKDGSNGLSFVNFEGFWELKTALLSEKMFQGIENIVDIGSVNLIKIKILDLLSVLVRNSKRGDISHKEIECILFNVIPEYNSDYVKVAQSSNKLLDELSCYFSKYIKNNDNDRIDSKYSGVNSFMKDFNKLRLVDKEEREENGIQIVDEDNKEDLEIQDDNENNDEMVNNNQNIGLNNLLEYYTNGLTKRIIYSISNEGISDLMYTLTSFNNRSLDMKVIFDLTVQFCKYFDSICQELPEYNINSRNDECKARDMDLGNSLEEDTEMRYRKLVSVFYSFNYILMFVNKYYNHELELSYFNKCDKLEDRSKEVKNVDDGKEKTQKEEKQDHKKEENKEEREDEIDEYYEEDQDGKGDYILSTSTLMITRSRYYVFSKNTNVKYLALLCMYRGLISVSGNEYIFRIRVHEVWDCISHSLEINLNQLRVVTVLLDIFQLVAVKIFYFIEKRLINIFEILEQIVLNEEQVIGVADERNSTVRYKCYSAIVKFTEEISKRVNNRNIFSKIMLISIKIYTPKTCGSIKEKLDKIFLNLSKKDPTLVRNVLLEINKGEYMNTSFIKYAFKKDLKILFNKAPPQRILLNLPIIN